MAEAIVTGVTGFLGAHLVRRLLAAGHQVHALVRPSASLDRLQSVLPHVVRWTGDVTDLASLTECFQAVRPGIIFHLAGDTQSRRFDGDWSTVQRAIDVNTTGTLNVIRAAAAAGGSVRTLIRTGGLEEYGVGTPPFLESHREQPRSPYSASQVAATHWCQMLQPHLDFSVVTVRPALVYGPEQSFEFLIPALIRALLRRQEFPMTSGRQRRDLLYVDDFVSAALLAAETSGLAGKVINVSSGEAHPVIDVARRIAQLLDAEHLLLIGRLPDRTREVPDLIASNEEAQAALGWRPATALDDGLQRTIAWHRRVLENSSSCA